MKIFCAFHPTRLARWSCKNCNTDYCDDCVTRNKDKVYGRDHTLYLCPFCDLPLREIELSNIIEPFWRRLGSIFLYPLHVVPMILMLIVSSIITMVILQKGFWGYVGLFILVILWLRYVFSALYLTSHGQMHPPPLVWKTFTSDLLVVFGLLGILVGVFLVTVFLATVLGPSLGGGIALILSLLLVPAMTMVLVSSGSLFTAMNPFHFVLLITRIGWSYLLLVLFLNLLALAPGLIQEIPGNPMYAPAMIFFSVLLSCYYTLISYHLMGYVLFQYHEALGYQVKYAQAYLDEFNQKRSDLDKGLSNISVKAGALIKEGRTDEALVFIRDNTCQGFTDLDLAEQYYALLKLENRVQEMLQHGKVLIKLLSQVNKRARMGVVYLECSAQDPAFALDAQSAFKVAEFLEVQRKFREVVRVINSFILAHPGDPRVPEGHFLTANIWHEHLHDSAKAVRLLEIIVKRYPTHELVLPATSLLEQIKCRL